MNEQPKGVAERAAELQTEHAVNVTIGSRSIQEQFLPAFLKEVQGMHPEDRVGVWVGFVSAALGAMAAEVGIVVTKAACEGVLEGVEKAVEQAKAKQPGALLRSLVSGGGYDTNPAS